MTIELSYQALWDNLHESQKLDLETIFRNLNYTPDKEEILLKFERDKYQNFFNCCISCVIKSVENEIEKLFFVDDFYYKQKFQYLSLEKLPGKTSFVLRALIKDTKINVSAIIEYYNQIIDELDRFKHLFCFNTCINHLVKECTTNDAKQNALSLWSIYSKNKEKIMPEYRRLLENGGYIFNSKLFLKALT